MMCFMIQPSLLSERHNASHHQIDTSSGAQSQAVLANASGCNGAAKPRARARRGQATDPHSIAERVSMPLYCHVLHCKVLG